MGAPTTRRSPLGWPRRVTSAAGVRWRPTTPLGKRSRPRRAGTHRPAALGRRLGGPTGRGRGQRAGPRRPRRPHPRGPARTLVKARQGRSRSAATTRSRTAAPCLATLGAAAGGTDENPCRDRWLQRGPEAVLLPRGGRVCSPPASSRGEAREGRRRVRGIPLVRRMGPPGRAAPASPRRHGMPRWRKCRGTHPGPCVPARRAWWVVGKSGHTARST